VALQKTVVIFFTFTLRTLLLKKIDKKIRDVKSNRIVSQNTNATSLFMIPLITSGDDDDLDIVILRLLRECVSTSS
jgi:hypothetical protein